MANYLTKDIRNVALMGHGSEGKTTLMEALLFAAGAIDRQGRVEDGNTVTDFDAEETKRHISISAATAPIEWKQKMLNFVDVPGYFDFIGEMMGPLRVVETADPMAYVQDQEPGLELEKVEEDGVITISGIKNGLWFKYEFTED